MSDADFDYRACTCHAVRTFRLHRDPPVIVEFFAIRYSLEFFSPPGTGAQETLVARLPWQDLNYARELCHAGPGVIRKQLRAGYEVECGTLQEVLFLRLVRQGEAEELAGPHLKTRIGHR